MAKSRHFDLICVIAVIAALIITVLFMNGEALGITPIVTEENQSGYFTDNDLADSWEVSSATIITLTGDDGTVEGNGAYIVDGDVHIVYAGYYVISGELTDGSVIINADGDDKIWVQLNGVSLTCSDGAAFVVKEADKVFLNLAEGTENTITDGETYSDENVEDGERGAIFARDDLTINGSGSLTVTGNYRHGIVANDDLVITNGHITITAKEDAVHANDSVRIRKAQLTIDAGDDGITVSNDDATDYLYIESGTITINSCYEGLEANQITIVGGTITIYPTDDGINATGTSSSIDISGGDITIVNSTGMDADGMDSNGSIYISGGTIFISVVSDGASTALDYGSENGGTLEINGGTVIAAGGSGMLEEVSSNSAQGFVVYTGNSVGAGSSFSLKNADGDILLTSEIPISFSALILSTDGMENGVEYTLSIGDEETTLTAGESSSSFGGFSFNFGGGGGRQRSSSSDASEDMTEPDFGDLPEGMTAPDFEDLPEGMSEGMTMPDFENAPDGSSMPDFGNAPDGSSMPDFNNGSNDASSDDTSSDDSQTNDSTAASSDNAQAQTNGGAPSDGANFPGAGGGSGGASSDANGDNQNQAAGDTADLIDAEEITETGGSDEALEDTTESASEDGEINETIPDYQDGSGNDTDSSTQNSSARSGGGFGGGQNMGNFNFSGGFSFGSNDEEDESEITVNQTTWILLGLSVAVLAAGLIYAFRKKGKR